jgi:PAS domain S-box-containing protein
MVNSPVLPQPATPARILVVEDEGLIAAHISALLVRNGYEVVGISESSGEALAKVSELRPEMVLMDIHIKGEMDGIETAAAVRDRFKIPVIFLTAHADKKTIDRAKLTGASGFLTKPVHHTALATSIEMALHKNQACCEVERQRAWIETVLATITDAMVVIDRDNKIQFLNGPAEKLTGWTIASARELDIGSVLPVADLIPGLPANETHSAPRLRSQLPQGLVAKTRSGESFPVEGEISWSLEGAMLAGSVITFREANRSTAG